MADEQKPKAEKLENLELNRETVQDLTDEQADGARGGEGRLTPAILQGGHDGIIDLEAQLVERTRREACI